jgi:16S rRNA (uracil1498-N3)-methyltransferase
VAEGEASRRASAAYAHPLGQPVTQVVVDALDAATLTLDGDEAKHLAKVLRAKAGDRFAATDGAGTIAELVVERVGRGTIEATVLERHAVPPPKLRLWLAAEAEGSRADWLVEKAAELGAWAFLPLDGADPGRRARFRRLARAALKQSLGAWALRVEGERPALEVAQTVGFSGAWVGEPRGADPLLQPLAQEGDWLLVSGPPRGFEPAALAVWAGLPGAVPVRLGERRLRAETAALALLVAAALRAGPAPETA